MAKNSKQPGLNYGENDTTAQGPVECLGQTFPNDEARRAHFTEKLREKLKDPAFRKIQGFPIGDDEDILALSDPPYYTACPNPWISDFIKYNGSIIETTPAYHCEPFVADVSEGKNHPIYNAHSYHTKVPHRAIMHFLLHYTQPGDIVFDGFCGTGMTGVAAQLCGDRNEVQSLGYRVQDDGTVLNDAGKPFAKLGIRKAVLNDLSPAATFIAYNYNTPINADTFEIESLRILSELEQSFGWMYETHHIGSKVKGTINYTVWSDVFVCPNCTSEIVFWDAALDQKKSVLRNDFECPNCKKRTITKREAERAWTTSYDSSLGIPLKQLKQIPVLIDYDVNGKRFTKKPDKWDLDLIDRIQKLNELDWFPTQRMPPGDESRRNDDVGITHTHHIYQKRTRLVLARYTSLASCSLFANRLRFVFTSAHQYCNRLCRLHVGNFFHRKGGTVDKPLEGTLYFPSLSLETNAIARLKLRSRLSDVFRANTPSTFIASQSLTNLHLVPAESVDYVFLDPPFGANISYSDLNFIWESWLRVATDNTDEAIESRGQNKNRDKYRELMRLSFLEAYRILKPGRWLTVEFSNTKSAIWNCIQAALQDAGFVVSNVSSIDKQKGSFKSVTTTTAVKQDLIISAYKPSLALENKFNFMAGTEAGAWEFVRSHLQYVPTIVVKANRAEVVAARQGYLLFDRMVAFHIQRGYSVPLSASEFYSGLRQKFPERDGMYFLPDQVSEYDRNRLEVKQAEQHELFVSDEKSAIRWVRRQLSQKQMTYQQLSPLYMQEAQRVWEKHEQPLELRTILEQNFVEDEAGKWCVPDPKNESHLEQLRHRALMKEFQQYLDTKGKLKVVRTEALRAGFKESWQKKDYTTIVQMAKRVPDAVIQEDQSLLMYFDNASLLNGE